MTKVDDQEFYFDSEDIQKLANSYAKKRKTLIPSKHYSDFENEEQEFSRHFQKQKNIRKEEKVRAKPATIKKKVNFKKNTSENHIGRPGNKQIEKEHLLVSQSFNDVIYHFCRLMIFLKLKEDKEIFNHSLNLKGRDKQRMDQAEHIMNLQNFPDFDSVKPTFLLHPNSLHFVFQYLKQKEQKNCYNIHDVKFMFLAFLKKRKILSSSVYSYINAYWSDIIYLVNKTLGDVQMEIQQENLQIEDRINEISAKSGYPEGQPDRKFHERNLNAQETQGKEQPRRTKRVDSQLQCLKEQLMQDESITAYEIACYLYACCLKFQIRITNEC